MVEFIYRCGDITSSSNGTLSKEAMNAGSKMHRKLQKMAGSYYDAEVPLKITMKKGIHDLDVTVEGRADGIIDLRGEKNRSRKKKEIERQVIRVEDRYWNRLLLKKTESLDLEVGEDFMEQNSAGTIGQMSEMDEPADGMTSQMPEMDESADVTIDEIKGVYRKLADIEVPETVHVAQAMCYAYIYAKEQSLDRINVQITYVNLESEEVKLFLYVFSCSFLEKWFHDTVDEMMKWVDHAVSHARSRDASITELEFPYEYRKGQKQMAACVYKAIEGECRLFVQAPTGIGKTMAAMFPSVKAFATGLVSKIFYLTAKTIAGTVPDQALTLLRERGVKISSVMLTAKEKICLNETMECDAEHCPYAKGHFDRVNDALFELITQEEKMDREIIRAYAERYQVCPFELGLDASLFADAIIGDYNYVFDPRVNLKRFFSQTAYDTGRYVFLVDEAHNLVDRASSMYSATLYKEDFLAVKRLVMPYSKKLARSLESCNRELLELKKKCPEHGYQILNDIGVLYLKLLHLHTTMEAFLEDYKQIPERKEVLEFYFVLTTFLNIADLIDDSYVIYDELTPDGRFMVRLYCVHPANNLKLCLDKGVSTVFFSATILPVKYYMEMLSDTATDQAIYIPSPFDPEKRQIMVGVDVSTKYTRRSVKEYKRVAEYIRQLFNAHSGNYMVFLPSYKMLQEVYEQMIEGDCSGMELLCQEQNMKEADREAFLDHFSAKRNVVAFCIMGGIFSEGIDLTGERLIGSVVVGPGLPQVCNERKIMMDYFNARKSMEAYAGSSVDGFKYAYLYPGINKVFQSAGRVIRTEADTGVILLLDERFGTGEYNSLFPVEWQDAVFGNFDRLTQKVENFWKREEES